MTILYFPKLQEDELFYSWVARYGKHTGSYGPKALQEELFGDRNSSAVMDFPINLEVFVERLSQIKPGLNAAELIKQTTLWPYYRPFLPESRAVALVNSMKIGHGNDIHTRLGLAAGRVPEANNVKVCPKCIECQLETRGEPYIQRLFQLPSVWVCPEHQTYLAFADLQFRPQNKHFFKPLCDALDRPVLSTGFESFSFDKLLRLALDSQDLLKNSYLEHELDFWQPQYLELLPKEFRKGLVSVDQDALRCRIESFWGKALLVSLGVAIEPGHDNWLQKLSRKHRSVFHPLLHLLLFRALNPNGHLNDLVCVDQRKNSTKQDSLKRKPMSSLSQDLLTTSRQEWEVLMSKCPDDSITKLRRYAPALYTRLYRHDREWLKLHSPKTHRKGNYSENRVDWVGRDFRLAKAALKMVKVLLSESVGQRVSATFVLKRLNAAATFEKNKGRFPLVCRVLKRYCETVDDYQIRRIAKVCEDLEARSEVLKEWKIYREARLRDNISTKVRCFIEQRLYGDQAFLEGGNSSEMG